MKYEEMSDRPGWVSVSNPQIPEVVACGANLEDAKQNYAWALEAWMKIRAKQVQK